jgi:hypothetical protein
MLIIWWSKYVGVILNVLVCDVWINVSIQTSALVGPLYTESGIKFTVHFVLLQPLPPISLRPVLILPSCLQLSLQVTYSVHVLRPKFCIRFTYVITGYTFTKHARFAYHCSDSHKRMVVFQILLIYWLR